MQISYKDSKLKKICETSRTAIKNLGSDCAKKLQTRLSDIDAASNVNELITGHPHPLNRDRAGQFSVRLSGGKRLVFIPDHEPIPSKEDGSIDWSSITSVTIIFIGDYHD